SQPFGQALPEDGYVWASNAQMLNNIVVLGAGYDLSGDPALLAAARESMDYLLGRNALDLSYITGYGTRYVQNQHSRWFAHQADPSLPHPPAGSVAGGPNADFGTWDEAITALYPGKDCAPQLAYVDDIYSWATNEITINWNSALAAAAAYLAFPEACVIMEA
ncbi:MAG: glycoside hydrolase family 9 protein, partial [Demequina sp.]